MKRFSLLVALLLTFTILSSAFAQTTNVPVQGRRKGHLGRRFQAMDKNNDGQISRDEWTRKPKAFDKLDLNHDGVITKEEIKQVKQMRRGRR